MSVRDIPFGYGSRADRREFSLPGRLNSRPTRTLQRVLGRPWDLLHAERTWSTSPGRHLKDILIRYTYHINTEEQLHYSEPLPNDWTLIDDLVLEAMTHSS